MSTHLLSVTGAHVDLITQFIDHYQSLLVDSIILTIHQERENQEELNQVLSLCKEKGVTDVDSVIGPWNEDSNLKIFDKIKLKNPSDWYLVADIDELQLYPYSIEEVIYRCENSNADYVGGCCVDRISRSGALNTLTKEPLWKQFPLGGSVLHPITGAAVNKVTLSRGTIRTCAGQHLALNGTMLSDQECYTQIHHFRWDASILKRLKYRIEKFENNEWQLLWPDYLLEMHKTIEYFSNNQNKIDIKDERFLLGVGGDSYHSLLEWDRIKKHAIQLKEGI